MPVYGDAKRAANARYRRRHAEIVADEKTISIRLDMPAGLAARIQRLYDEGIAKGTGSWRNRTAVYTDLIRRGFLSLDHPVVEEARPYLEVKAQLDARRSQRIEAQSLFAQSREEIDELLAEKEDTVAIQHFHTSIDAATKMSPTVWRDWLIRKLLETYPELAKQEARGVAVMPMAPKARRHG